MNWKNIRKLQPDTKAPKAVAGILSLVLLAAAFCIGVFSTMAIASRTEEMASLGMIAGIGLGFLASIPSFVCGIVGLIRREKPLWPAAVGTYLSFLPGGIGVIMLVGIIFGRR